MKVTGCRLLLLMLLQLGTASAKPEDNSSKWQSGSGKLQPAIPSDGAPQPNIRESRRANFQGYNSPVPPNPIHHGYNAPSAAQSHRAQDDGLGNRISAILNELTGGAVGTIIGGSFPQIPSGSNVNFFTAIDPIETQPTPKPHHPIIKRPQKEQIHAFIAIAPDPITNGHQSLSTGGHKAPFKQVEPPSSLYGTPLSNRPITSFEIHEETSNFGFNKGGLPISSGGAEVNGHTLVSTVPSLNSVPVAFETNSFTGGEKVTSGLSSAAPVTGSATPTNVGIVPASQATVGFSFGEPATAAFAPAVSATAGFVPGFSSTAGFAPADSAAPGFTGAVPTTAGFAPSVHATAKLDHSVPATTGFGPPAINAVGISPPAPVTTGIASPVSATAGIFQNAAAGFAPAVSATTGFVPGFSSTAGFAPADSAAPGFTGAVPTTAGFAPSVHATAELNHSVPATTGFGPPAITAVGISRPAPDTTGIASPVSATAGIFQNAAVGFAPAVSATTGFVPGFSSTAGFAPADSAAPGFTSAVPTTAGFAPFVHATAELDHSVPATTGFGPPALTAVGISPPAPDITGFASPVSATAGIFQNAVPTSQFVPAGAGISITDETGGFAPTGTVAPSPMISFGIAVPSAVQIPETVFQSNQAPQFNVPQSIVTSDFIGSSVTPTPDLTFRGEVGVGNALEAPISNAGHSVTSGFNTLEQFPTSVGGAGFGSSGFDIPLPAATGVTPAPGPFESTQFFNFGGLGNGFNEPNQPASISSSLNPGSNLAAGQGTLVGSTPGNFDNGFGAHGSGPGDIDRGAGTGSFDGGFGAGGSESNRFDSGLASIGAANSNQNPITNFGNQVSGVSLFDTGSQGNFAGPTVATQNLDSGSGPLIGSEGFNNLIKRDIPGGVNTKDSE